MIRFEFARSNGKLVPFMPEDATSLMHAHMAGPSPGQNQRPRVELSWGVAGKKKYKDRLGDQ